MKAAFVITLIAAINYARTVQHTKDKTNIERKQSHSSEGEGTQSLVISSRAKLTSENASGPIQPEPYEMDMLDGSELNEDESFVLVPLKNLMKNPRKPRDTTSGDAKDPLYVMIPYKEISRKSKDFGEPVDIITLDDRIAVKRSVSNEAPNHTHFENSGPKRKERSIARFKTKKISKRHFKYPSSLNRLDDTNFAKVADSEALWEVPLAKYLSNGVNPYALARTPKATYKSKKSLGVNELRNQLHQELSPSVPQKPRVFTEFRDLNPKSKDIQGIISKQRKASNGPVNITMYITNLIPPNEVENTRITNSGKLFKSGCLKFSIQLEKPCGLCPNDCCPDECCNHSVGSCKSPFDTLSAQHQKVGCGHIERVSEENNSTVPCNHPSSGSAAGSHVLGCWRKSNSPENSQPGAVAPGKAPAAHSVSATTEAPSSIESNPAANRDVTSLLMQLMGLEKKPAKKPSSSSAQAVLMDADIVKELQRLLISNQGSTPATADSFKANYAAPQTQSPIAQHNQKAKAIADALNLFSKFTSIRQPVM